MKTIQRSKRAQILGALLLFFIASFVPTYPQVYAEMIRPLDAPYQGLTGTFGEYRPGRFHMGIDFRTRANGLRVVAAKDGYVSRIGVRKRGFGKVLYLKHPDGTTTVYAHLDRFEDRKTGIESLVRDTQEKQGTKHVEVYPGSGQIKVNKGQLIAFSGETGSGLSHLHFELRSGGNIAINPLRNGLSMYDGYFPTFESVTFQSLDETSTINGEYYDRTISADKVGIRDRKMFFSISSSETVPVISGRVRVKARASDYVGNDDVKVGIYRLGLYIDDVPYYTIAFDRVSYSRNHKSGLLYDHESSRLKPTQYYHHLYHLAGNNLAYNADYSDGDGVWDTRLVKDGRHTVKLVAEDARRNESVLSLPVIVANEAGLTEIGEGENISSSPNQSSTRPIQARIIDHDTFVEILIERSATLNGSLAVDVDGRPLKLFYKGGSISGVYPKSLGEPGRRTVHIKSIDKSGRREITELSFTVQGVEVDKGGTIESDDGLAQLSIPPDGAYEDMFINVERVDVENDSNSLPRLSPAYRFTPSGLAFDKETVMSIVYPDNIEPDRVGVYRYDGVNRKWGFLGLYNGESPDGTVSAEVGYLSTYALFLDNSPPQITGLFPSDGSELATNKLKKIYALMEDIGMGLNEDSMVMMLDGKKVEAEFDPDRSKFAFPVGENARSLLSSGTHELRVEVKDLAGNVALPLISHFKITQP